MICINRRLVRFAIIMAGLVLRGVADDTDMPTDGLGYRITDNGVLVTDGEKKVLFYQRTPTARGVQPPRAHYVHPLYGLDGDELTEDCPEDHRHHRGVFWAWHQLIAGGIHAGDSWAVRNFEWHVESVTPDKLENGAVTLRMVVQWRSADFHDGQQAVLRERSQITVFPLNGGRRAIDFSMQLRSNHEVLIGGSDNAKGYGGFSVRLKLPEDIAFSNERGPVVPMVNAVEASPWMTMTGSFTSSQPSAVTVMTHPDCVGYPHPWILRARNSMQNAAWPGRTPVPLNVTNLKYRILLHPASEDPKQVSQWYAEWANPKHNAGR